MFWSLGSFRDLPQEAGKAMQSSVLRDLES